MVTSPLRQDDAPKTQKLHSVSTKLLPGYNSSTTSPVHGNKQKFSYWEKNKKKKELCHTTVDRIPKTPKTLLKPPSRKHVYNLG